MTVLRRATSRNTVKQVNSTGDTDSDENPLDGELEAELPEELQNVKPLNENMQDKGLHTGHLGSVLPLKDARTAHDVLAGAPHKPGKIVLEMAA